MSSDKARVSHDANQQYRTVVAQQGRVTLEADWNEAQQISSEEEQANLINIIGSSGTPDDGYRVLETGKPPTPPFDFSVQQGTMYVGGNRVVLPNEVQYNNQSEWLDRIGDPDWVDPSIPNTPTPQKEFVYLLLREQEVSAVEDSVLRETALGGPDTTQRTRLIQRIVRSQTEENSCATALDFARKHWLTKGLAFDSKTMGLKSATTLQVSFLESAIPPDLCDPEARGGYLGAENQLIRVQISAVDLKKNQYKLIWGFDNASFLYRVTADSTGQILKLQTEPVDDFHRPQTGQTVEVLRSAARLSNGEFIASATGQVVTLLAPYNRDTQEINLPAPLPSEYLDLDLSPRLFLRIWEQEINFTPDVPVSLGETGLQVTLSSPSQPFHVDDYWFFAVRPLTSTSIYPQRYFDSPQPSEGPTLWICPLAVISWSQETLKVLEDCRQHFDNLVELTKRSTGGCCNVIIRPEDLKGNITLQSIADKFTDRDHVTICLMPGVYILSAPLQLGVEHSNLTLAGCHDGVVFEAESGKESNFLHGMIVLNHANNVTLRNLRFQLPSVPFIASGGTIAGLKASLTSKLLGSRLQDLQVSIGIRPLHCALLTVDNCLFRYELKPQADLFGVGIFAGSECWGLTVQHCSFLHEEKYLQNLQEPLRVLIGYLLAPSLTLRSLQFERTSMVTKQTAGGSVTRSLLQDATFANNRFAGLTFATLIMADTGNVTITNNTVVDCYSGFWLLTLRALSLQDEKLRQIIASESTTDPITTLKKLVALSVLGMTQEPVTYLAILFSQSYPLPPQFNPRDAVQVLKGEIRRNTVLQPVTLLMERASVVFSDPTSALPNLNLADVANNMQTLNITGFATKETIGFAKALGDRLEVLKLEALQRSVQFPLQLSLDFSHNSVQTLAHKAISGTPLFVWDTDEQTQSMMTMNANRLSNKSLQLATAVILQVDRCVVTGNLVLNESIYERKPNTKPSEPLNVFYSLFLLPGWISPELLNNPPTIGFDVPIAITGNVFKGFPFIFHVRPFLEPLNLWFPLNTQTW